MHFHIISWANWMSLSFERNGKYTNGYGAAAVILIWEVHLRTARDCFEIICLHWFWFFAPIIFAFYDGCYYSCSRWWCKMIARTLYHSRMCLATKQQQKGNNAVIAFEFPTPRTVVRNFRIEFAKFSIFHSVCTLIRTPGSDRWCSSTLKWENNFNGCNITAIYALLFPKPT